jgi:hypothetical protein
VTPAVEQISGGQYSVPSRPYTEVFQSCVLHDINALAKYMHVVQHNESLYYIDPNLQHVHTPIVIAI